MSVEIFGLRFDDVDVATATRKILARGRLAPFTYVVTPNVDHLARLREDGGLAAIYRGAGLRLLDSRVIAHLARLLGHAAPQVATGADLVAALLPALAARRERLCVIGMTAPQAVLLETRYPGLNIIHHEPPMGFDRDEAAFEAARRAAVAAAAPVTLLAVGSPRQERLAAAIAADPAARGVGLCVGAAPLFAIGALRRAPRLLNHAGLEWLWRLASEPRRLATRYLWHDPPALLAIGRDLRRTACRTQQSSR